MASPPLQTGPARIVTIAEARELAIAAVAPATRRLPGFGADDFPEPYFPDYYFFELTWDNPRGSVIVDHFAVDPRTGDVWSAILCWEIKSGSLKRLQREIRKRIGLTESEYRKVRRRGPMCERRTALTLSSEIVKIVLNVISNSCDPSMFSGEELICDDEIS